MGLLSPSPTATINEMPKYSSSGSGGPKDGGVDRTGQECVRSILVLLEGSNGATGYTRIETFEAGHRECSRSRSAPRKTQVIGNGSRLAMEVGWASTRDLPSSYRHAHLSRPIIPRGDINSID